MSIGGSQRVMLRLRVPLLVLFVPVLMAVGLLWLGHGAAARATQLLVHQPLTLHGGPGTAFSVLATLASGTRVEVLWCNAQASWCLVENGDVEGWAPRAELITHDASSAPASGNTTSTAGASPPKSVATDAGDPAKPPVGTPAQSLVESSVSGAAGPSASLAVGAAGAAASVVGSASTGGTGVATGLHLSLAPAGSR
jgi:uncharacterized protein YraI